MEVLEALPEVRNGLGGPPGAQERVGMPFWRSRMGREALQEV